MPNVAVGADIEIVVRMVGNKRILPNYTLCPYIGISFSMILIITSILLNEMYFIECKQRVRIRKF